MATKWMLLRGLGRGNGHWGRFPELLKEAGIDVELMEIPGNGTQYFKKTPLDAMQIVADIKSRSKLIKADEKINVCAISLGGMIALKWADEIPNDLGSLVIVNSSLGQLSPTYHRLRLGNFPKLLKILLNSSSLDKEKTILELISNEPSNFCGYLKKFAKFSEENRITLPNLLRQIVLANRISIKTPIKVKTRIVYSEKDRLVNPCCSEALVRKLGLEYFVHPTAGHDLPLDAPEWLAKLVVSLEA